MWTFIEGLLLLAFGIWVLFIPIAGWIVGPILIIAAIVTMLVGLADFVIAFIGLFISDDDKIEYKKENTDYVENVNFSPAEELTKLSLLLEKGHLTQEEFKGAKKELFS